MSQRRKLAAILSADAVGYARLMGDDERATLSTLTAYRQIFAQHIAAHEGRVIDSPGDALLAEFPSAIEAVSCTVDIQRELAGRNASLPEHRRMRFRIGVDLGDVTEQDGALYGDGVNIAARLQSLAEPGGICVSGTVYDQAEGRLPVAFRFAGEQSVKNIVKPVRAYHVQLGLTSAAESVARRARPSVMPRALPKWLRAAAVVLLVGAGALAVWKREPRDDALSAQQAVGPAAPLPLPDKPSIAVLPFVNISGDKEQEYFSDGMTEDVITGLSKRSGLFVIARNSVFAYKGQAVKPERVSRELGVRYVLEGSVRKAGNRVRITAQLIDATTGYHLWAENYDGDLEDVFALQDRITRQIVAALAPKLTAPEHPRRQETDSIEAYDHLLRGVALFYDYRKDSNAMARQRFERAIALDPNYAKAYVWLSWAHFLDWELQWTDDPGALDRSHEAARKAVALDDSMSDGHTVLGWTILWRNRQHDIAIAELERAASLDPNSEWAHGFLAETLNLAGRPDEAIGFTKRAMRLDPNYPAWLALHLADSYFLLRRYDEALAALHDSLRRNPNFLPARRTLAAVYAELGRDKEARAEVGQILRISPDASLERWRDRLAFKNAADVDRYVAGLQKAGLK